MDSIHNRLYEEISTASIRGKKSCEFIASRPSLAVLVNFLTEGPHTLVHSVLSDLTRIDQQGNRVWSTRLDGSAHMIEIMPIDTLRAIACGDDQARAQAVIKTIPAEVLTQDDYRKIVRSDNVETITSLLINAGQRYQATQEDIAYFLSPEMLDQGMASSITQLLKADMFTPEQAESLFSALDSWGMEYAVRAGFFTFTGERIDKLIDIKGEDAEHFSHFQAVAYGLLERDTECGDVNLTTEQIDRLYTKTVELEESNTISDTDIMMVIVRHGKFALTSERIDRMIKNARTLHPALEYVIDARQDLVLNPEQIEAIRSAEIHESSKKALELRLHSEACVAQSER